MSVPSLSEGLPAGKVAVAIPVKAIVFVDLPGTGSEAQTLVLAVPVSPTECANVSVTIDNMGPLRSRLVDTSFHIFNVMISY